ncbi:MAG: hypothetical protein JWP57_4716 [Spirosoma sp.]|nr:hypothetical protein [Spirosoma sp.]
MGVRLVQNPAASDTRVNGDGRGISAVEYKVDRLRCGFVGQEVRRRAGWVGLKAQRAADYITGSDRQVDIPNALCPELAGDVLRGVNRHLNVDVKKAQTDESMEEVNVRRQGGSEMKVRYCPGDEQGGERGRGVE